METMEAKKLTVKKSRLVEAMAAAGMVVARVRTSIPVLKCVKLASKEDGACRISATDLDHGVNLEIGRAAPGPRQAILLESKMLKKLVSTLPGPKGRNISIELSGKALVVEDLRLTPEIDIADCPAEPEFEGGSPEPSITIPARELARAMDATLFAISDEVVRMGLTGLFFQVPEQAPNLLNIVASDGKRLSWAWVPGVAAPAAETCEFILPPEPCRTLRRMLDTATGDVRIRFGNLYFGPSETVTEIPAPEEPKKKDAGDHDHPHLEFELSNGRLWSRPVDSCFPDYGAVVPEPPLTWTIPLPAFREAVARAAEAMMSSERGQKDGPLIHLALKGDSIHISCKTATMKIEKEVPAAGPASGKTKALVMSFNGVYLQEYLDALDPRTAIVKMRVSKRDCAARFDVADNRLYVLMPLTPKD